ncbi:MAG: hypothetical protein IPL35_13645 [Sphingobacteriales bacterium]|nr:hypothetical protein [Sphingobacteriales bacterium]
MVKIRQYFLKFGNFAQSDIRISFKADRGSWSHIGKNATYISQNNPTMNFGWLKDNTDIVEINRVVLHEFGHALGLVHEHQSPVANINWNKAAVKSYYLNNMGWSESQVESNVFQMYSVGETNFTAFDAQSIMLYPIDKRLTTDNFSTNWNTDLSVTDKEFIGSIYPFHPHPKVEIGSVLNGSISKNKEIDMFELNIANSGVYGLETLGTTDVILYVYSNGQNNENLIGQDDDSGVGTNAKLELYLENGKYYVKIIHYYPDGRGDYQLKVVKNE